MATDCERDLSESLQWVAGELEGIRKDIAKLSESNSALADAVVFLLSDNYQLACEKKRLTRKIKRMTP